jgi:hypothetical protein
MIRTLHETHGVADFGVALALDAVIHAKVTV